MNAVYKYGRKKEFAKISVVGDVYHLTLDLGSIIVNKIGSKDFIESYVAQNAFFSASSIIEANEKAKNKIKLIDGVCVFGILTIN